VSPANQGVFELVREMVLDVFYHSSKSSICATFNRLSLAFSVRNLVSHTLSVLNSYDLVDIIDGGRDTFAGLF
jgi:hypothetical protein